MNRPSRSARARSVLLCVLLSALLGCAPSTDAGHREPRPTSGPNRSVEWEAWKYPDEDSHNITIGGPGALVWYRASTRDAFDDVVKHYEALSGIAGLSEPEPGGTLSEGDRSIQAYRTKIGGADGADQGTPFECRFFIREPTYAVTALIRQTSPARRTSIEIIYEIK